MHLRHKYDTTLSKGSKILHVYGTVILWCCAIVILLSGYEQQLELQIFFSFCQFRNDQTSEIQMGLACQSSKPFCVHRIYLLRIGVVFLFLPFLCHYRILSLRVGIVLLFPHIYEFLSYVNNNLLVEVVFVCFFLLCHSRLSNSLY